MALGDAKEFAEYNFKSGTGVYNNSTNTFSWVLVTDTFASIDANQSNPQLSSFTQVASGGNYSGVTNLTGTSWSRSGAVSTLDFDNITFAADSSNPTTARCLVIINNTSANDDALRVTDLTTDGTTPANMTQGFTFSFNDNGANTITSNA